MSRFNVGDRVRWAGGEWEIRDSVEINGVVKHVVGNRPFQIFVPDDQCVPVPVPFLPDGVDVLVSVSAVGRGAATHATRADSQHAERVLVRPSTGVIRIDGQTGELSWAEGGPQ